MKKWTILLAVLSIALSANAQKNRPNIVLVISDDHAWQAISAYGSALAQTPNIDRIAREGARFDKAYVTNSICGPSRAVILTGKYSHKNGFYDNDKSVFDGNQNSFAKELQRHGYQTAWIGKWHLNSPPQGFDFWKILPGQGDYYNPEFMLMDGTRAQSEGYVSNLVEDFSEKWLDTRDTSRPFCLVVGHKAVHRNWLADTADLGRYDRVPFPLPANFWDDYALRPAAKVQDMTIAKTMLLDYDLKMNQGGRAKTEFDRLNLAQRAKMEAYYRAIDADFNSRNLEGKALTAWKFQRYMADYLNTAHSIDRNVGRLLNYLDAHALTENTVFIYMSDQGFYLGEHGWFDKRWMYEESFRTPMLLRWPGVIEPGSSVSDMVLNLDIAPTLCAVAQVPIPSDMQGKSLVPLLKREAGPWRDALYYHYYETTVHSVSPHFGIKTARYKLIRFYDRLDGWEFYDLKNDPSEMHNLYGGKSHRRTISKLKKALKKLALFYEDTEAVAILQNE